MNRSRERISHSSLKKGTLVCGDSSLEITHLRTALRSIYIMKPSINCLWSRNDYKLTSSISSPISRHGKWFVQSSSTFITVESKLDCQDSRLGVLSREGRRSMWCLMLGRTCPYNAILMLVLRSNIPTDPQRPPAFLNLEPLRPLRDLGNDDEKLVYGSATMPVALLKAYSLLLPSWSRFFAFGTLCEEERTSLSTWKRHPSGHMLSRLPGSWGLKTQTSLDQCFWSLKVPTDHLQALSDAGSDSTGLGWGWGSAFLKHSGEAPAAGLGAHTLSSRI